MTPHDGTCRCKVCPEQGKPLRNPLTTASARVGRNPRNVGTPLHAAATKEEPTDRAATWKSPRTSIEMLRSLVPRTGWSAGLPVALPPLRCRHLGTCPCELGKKDLALRVTVVALQPEGVAILPWVTPGSASLHTNLARKARQRCHPGATRRVTRWSPVVRSADMNES